MIVDSELLRKNWVSIIQMIFDFGGDLDIDEEQFNVVNEPHHSEAIKALFAGNPKLFLEILVQNNMD